jgi:hypothetical protein
MSNFSALSYHKSDTLKTSLQRQIHLRKTAVIPKKSGGDSHIKISAFLL